MISSSPDRTPAPTVLKRLTFVVLPLIFFVFIASALLGKAKPLVAGEAVPDFTAKTFEGSTVSLSDFRGRPVFLNFWASWCVPCIDEAPALAAVGDRYKDTELVMLGVNSEDLKEDAASFIELYGLHYTNLRDGPGNISKQLYGVRAYPETLLIDRNGILVEHVYGPMTTAEMNRKIDRLLGGDRAGEGP